MIFKHLYRAEKINLKTNKKKKDGLYDKNHKSRKNKRRTKIICYKVKDKIKNAYHKISKYLYENYDVVLLPEFKSSGMIRKENSETCVYMVCN